MYALESTKDKIIENFYSQINTVTIETTKLWTTSFEPEKYKRPIKLQFDLIDAKKIKKFLAKGEKLNIVLAKNLKEKGLNEILFNKQELIGKYIKRY